MEDNLISDILIKERWTLIWEVVRERSTISKLQHFSFLHPIINFSHSRQDQLQHHDQSKSEIFQVYYKPKIKEFFRSISKIINWKEIMKFILLYLEHSLLLLLPTKIKQPPIVHLPNLKDKQSQDEEESIHTKISKISSNQLIIKHMKKEL